MRTKSDTFITVASWEDRFLRGFARVLDEAPIRSAVVLYSHRYSAWTIEAREKVHAMCIDKGVDLETGVLHDTDTAASWSRTLTPVIAGLPTGASVLVDITTMPRDIIWQCFWLLELRRCTLSYVYHRPQQYGQWLSRDPGRPRLTYKMSGIARMGARTALVILAGYDIDRVKHLTDVFEPAVTLLGLQVDSVDPHNSSKMSAVKSAFAGDSSVELF